MTIIRSTRHRKGKAVAAAGSALVFSGLLLAGGAAPAAAAQSQGVEASVSCNWVNPANATGTTTQRQRTGPAGTAQVRSGYLNGVQYGWGRAVNTNGNYYIRFEADLTGNRQPNCVSVRRVGDRQYTQALRTSPSSTVAFRSCVVVLSGSRCEGTNTVTSWW
ncbi:hypothetical protein PJ985_17915 [Streptomyces sp. ACA25]|uniref:hypothetical protein n=1 Tax=Streptomyces sp. ACA25 TaxID=3022596 RepID=UPI002307CDD4|nr:hypothetical protein [Streptomyces sp. ACA25]MDB1089440.1 hypothetical protein [Streptomyces sp. ACA25]